MKYQDFKAFIRQAYVLARKLLSLNKTEHFTQGCVKKYLNDLGIRPTDNDLVRLVGEVRDKLDIDIEWEIEERRLARLGLSD